MGACRVRLDVSRCCLSWAAVSSCAPHPRGGGKRCGGPFSLSGMAPARSALSYAWLTIAARNDALQNAHRRGCQAGLSGPQKLRNFFSDVAPRIRRLQPYSKSPQDWELRMVSRHEERADLAEALRLDQDAVRFHPEQIEAALEESGTDHLGAKAVSFFFFSCPLSKLSFRSSCCLVETTEYYRVILCRICHRLSLRTSDISLLPMRFRCNSVPPKGSSRRKHPVIPSR